MTCGVTHVLKVIVFATGTHTALTAGGALVAAFFLAQENILELHHAGIDKQQRRVIDRHQRTGRHDRMLACLEKIQKGLP